MNHATAEAWSRYYPRPQLKRNSFLSLNGEWTVNGQPILVPWPPQAPLSGYDGEVPESLHYVTDFGLPQQWQTDVGRILLHFGAVDQVAKVFVNDEPACSHEGGYLPFEADITRLVQPGMNRLRVEVTDALDLCYPYGKQKKKRGGMWYTPVSGIWQTVWLEHVPDTYIRSIRIVPDLSGIDITVDSDAELAHIAIGSLEADIPCRTPARIDVPSPSLWTPDRPDLYDITITAGEDTVASYFALRTIDIRSIDGCERVCLNGKPILLQGVLDQGWFPDGLYLPAEPGSYEQDILGMKALGFNVLRKHIKIEPEAFYEACDRLGMLVIQDMVNNGPVYYVLDTVLPTVGFKYRPDGILHRNSRQRRIFEQHSRDTVAHLMNHPCIVMWTIFNEGWGQFDSDRLYTAIKGLDPSRLIDTTSGWFAQHDSDVDSEHCYFRNRRLHPRKRPMLLSECGGYTRPIPGHMWDPAAKYGYGAADTREALTERICLLYRKMVLPAIPEGLCGVIYTQLSDIEDEINGLCTYDREVLKVDPEPIRAMTEQANRLLEGL